MRQWLSVLALTVAMVCAGAPAWADCDYGKQCKKSKGKQCGGQSDCGDGSEYKCPITAKIAKKAGFFLKHDKEIGLSKEQVKTIKGIKNEARKAYIRMEADMQVFEVDLSARLSEPELDVNGLNAMMDQASAGWSSGAKAMIGMYAQLKGVLTAEQMDKAKALWEQQP